MSDQAARSSAREVYDSPHVLRGLAPGAIVSLRRSQAAPWLGLGQRVVIRGLDGDHWRAVVLQVDRDGQASAMLGKVLSRADLAALGLVWGAHTARLRTNGLVVCR